MMERKILRAAVVWYSQSGNTERYGRYIASLLKKERIAVSSGDYRELDTAAFTGANLVIAGSPVYYYEVPENFRNWLQKLPRMDGAAAASYVTFGGEGGNQHNTSYHLLRLLASKGASPAGMAAFGNMSTFALTWSAGGTERILKYRHKPDGGTFDAVRDFTLQALDNARKGIVPEYSGKTDLREIIKGGLSIKGTKLMIGTHTIDAASCTSCGLCVKKCPAAAINLPEFRVDTSRCIACLGCVNNCPAGAVNMTFMGKKVFGFREFLKRHDISITEPVV